MELETVKGCGQATTSTPIVTNMKDNTKMIRKVGLDCTDGKMELAMKESF
jgi:hypothetical protein